MYSLVCNHLSTIHAWKDNEDNEVQEGTLCKSQQISQQENTLRINSYIPW